MEVNGRDFLRNVSIEQERVELAEQQEMLEQQKRTSLIDSDDSSDTPPNSYPENPSNFNSYYQQEEEERSSNLDSINLSNNQSLEDIEDYEDNPEHNTKKKYIILGFSLVVLFIAVIMIMRVLSNRDQEDKLQNDLAATPSEIIKKDQVLDKIDSVDKPKQSIKDNLKRESKEKKGTFVPESVEEIEKPIKKEEKVKEEPIDIEKEIEKEIKKYDFLAKKIEPKKIEQPKVEKVEPKPKIANVPKRKIVIPPPEETNFVETDKTKISGFYIQIGAYGKKPSKKLLNKITQKGYSYTIYSVEVKGKMYNKVLIGAYPTKKLALKSIKNIRTDFGNPNAYILKF